MYSNGSTLPTLNGNTSSNSITRAEYWVRKSDCTDAIDTGKYGGKDLAAAFSNRGNAYQATGDVDRALADFEQAILVDASAAYAFNGRGNVYFSKREYEPAIADYTRAISLDPNAGYAFNGRGNAYKAKGDLDQALVDYDQAVRLDPNDEVAVPDP
jgi:tetratricopeptide (TPR) repeat protein